MRIVLFSASTEVKSAFGSAARGGFTLEIRAPSAIAKTLKDLSGGCFVYIDVSKLKEEEIGRLGRVLAEKGLPHGFVDPGDRVRDVALLFQRGAVDYIGSGLLKKGIETSRFKRAAGYSASNSSHRGYALPARAKKRESRAGKARAVVKPSEWKGTGSAGETAGAAVEKSEAGLPFATSWTVIEEGREYIFCLMYIELDNLSEIRKSLGESNIQLTVKTFKEWVERSIAPYGGRLWMWNEFNGLALFPFDGSSCDAVIPCLRLMLANRIFSADFPFLSTALSYRIALHIGSTVYRRKGDTGEIVSDALNSVFHLGRRFLAPGNFTITKAVYDRVPECLKSCFREGGAYDGTAIMRMRLPR